MGMKFLIDLTLNSSIYSDGMCRYVVEGHHTTVAAEMVGYILEKYQNGEINKQAISENCQKELYRYKNQEFLEKKKNKRS